MERLLYILSCFILVSSVKYDPNWESIDSRPLPSWYDEAKLGIFIHWGVFSVPSFSSEWFWYNWKGMPLPGVIDFMKKNYPPGFTYADFASQFTTEFYSAAEWASIFKASGAKYVVLTSKHHEGFTNWPSKYSFNWNANDTGPHRDLVGELADAVRSNTDLKFGLYHSMFEWFNPLFLQDKANNFTTNDYVEFKTLRELYEIVNTYKPEVVWSDGDPAPAEYWQSQKFLAWLYNESPVKDSVVVNDRWGNNCACHHGGYYTCADRYNPGKLQNHKWENCMTIDKYSWGYRRNARLTDYLTIDEIVKTLVETVSCGGNMLMNVGPTKDGKIAPIFEERLRQLGQWLGVNGEAIYSSKPWAYQNDTVTKGVWYTRSNATSGYDVYAIALTWPDGVLHLGAPQVSSATVVTLLGYDKNFNYTPEKSHGLKITIPPIAWNKLPCQYVVLTSKHHEGFTNWPSKYAFNWNANDTGPHRDLVGELADAVRFNTDLKFGLYHSLYEWFNPLYLQDKANNFTTDDFVKRKTLPELYEIVKRYKPEVVWSDGGIGPEDYWQSRKFLAWLYNESPVKDTVAVNDRWGNGCSCHHGGYYTCSDRYNPGTLQKHKWENCMTIDRNAWVYRRDARLTDYLTTDEIVKTLVETVSCGGNMLMNVGPTKDGKIAPIFEERLRQLGQWLGVNGEAIYGSKPWTYQNDTVTENIWYTMKSTPSGHSVYAISLSWPDDHLLLGAPIASTATVVTLLGYDGHFDYSVGTSSGIDIVIPPIAWNKLPCRSAWVFKLTGIIN
ncbi:hypothetical protein FSP39_011859 [Pinctada imbricata]|uniref:alpha-L-fucosidase n=1 Tax=Pinctada imbricata TaxID=66713 RepID=A0AA88YNU7_PINIB|nr:hypothetical protein FSP39_011859 [Pinctada imbricata]